MDEKKVPDSTEPVINIRSATGHDLPLLLQFEQGVISAERPFDPTLAHDPINYYDLQDLLASEDAELVVAESGGNIIGCGYAKIKKAQSFLAHEYYAYLGFMFTAPGWRGRGVNQLILEALSAWAAAKGLTEIRLEVYKDNAPAIRAYEKAGMVQHMIEMRMALPFKNTV